MQDINLNSIITKQAELLSSEVDGEIVMMNIETGRYIGMNSVGSEIWKLIDENSTTISSICQHLETMFNVSSEICEKETIAFCERLLKENLIKLN